MLRLIFKYLSSTLTFSTGSVGVVLVVVSELLFSLLLFSFEVLVEPGFPITGAIVTELGPLLEDFGSSVSLFTTISTELPVGAVTFPLGSCNSI